MSNVPFVHSGYERKENDDYQTVDKRCVLALVESVPLFGECVDICGSHGSGIVNALREYRHDAYAAPEAFARHEEYEWIVTNPPYDRKVVNKYVEHALAHVQEGLVVGAAFLMRANWDFAASRAKFFDSPLYAGQVRMRFRPWWTEERSAQPIHNYVWHIWEQPTRPRAVEQKIIYWPRHASNTLPKFQFQSK